MILWKSYIPELFLPLASLVLLLSNNLFIKSKRNTYYLWLALFIIALLLFSLTPQTEASSQDALRIFTEKGIFYLRVFLFVAGILLYLSSQSLLMNSPLLNEFSFFMGISIPVLSFLLSSSNLLIAFILIETVSFTFYILVSFQRNNLYSIEAGLKYFYLGTFSSLIFFMGLFLIYYHSTEFELSKIFLKNLSEEKGYLLLLGFILIFTALIFKLGGAPLHFWLPEVYQGAPFTVFPLLIALSKLAFGLLLGNIFLYWLKSQGTASLSVYSFHKLFYITSVLSMIIGNFLAIKQNEVKRLLAYSSIAHMGYLLSLLAVSKEPGFLKIYSGYLFIYSLTNLGFFMVLLLRLPADGSKLSLDLYQQVLPRSVFVLFTMMVFIFSLAGLPPTAGFITKLFILLELIKKGAYLLALIFLGSSILAIYYYFKLLSPLFKVIKEEIHTPKPQKLELNEIVVYISLFVISVYLIFSVFKPDFIFFFE